MAQLAQKSSLRRSMLPGWLQNSSTDSQVKLPACLRQLVSNLISVNVRTLKALQDELDNMLPNFEKKVTEDAAADYRSCLSPEEIEIYEYLVAGRLIKSEVRLTEYVDSISRSQALKYISDRRMSKYYPKLINVYGFWLSISATRREFINQLPADGLEVPPEYSFLDSPQDYVAYMEKERLAMSTNYTGAITLAGELLLSVKPVMDERSLDAAHLDALISKLLPLKGTSISAEGQRQEIQRIFGSSRRDWWNEASNAEKLPNEARAYENARISIPLFNFVVPVACLSSTIPIGFACMHSSPHRGSSHDSDFYQIIASAMLQLLSLATLVYPTIYHARISRLSWVFTWLFSGFSTLCTIISIPLYLYVPTAWSIAVFFAASVAQSLILLQIVNSL